MNYEEALNYIESTPKFSPKKVIPGKEPFNLETITELLHRLGDPQDHLKYIHVAGTNGKGSTVAFISSILMESGLKVGIYTSPFLINFTERIRIGKEEIPKDDLARLTEKVSHHIEAMKAEGLNAPSEFEIVCAVAFLYFLENNCDIVVLEVGLGGRLDATNVIKHPELAIITTIALDHTEILGDTLEKIAGEKAGIIKDNCKVLLYPQPDSVEKVFENVCHEKNSVLNKAVLPTKLLSADITGQSFELSAGGLHNYKISLLGSYQINNAAMAVQAAQILRKSGYSITDENISDGLLHAEWMGRFELLQQKPDVIIDGSHNEEGVGVLAESLHQYFNDKKILFITGVLADKAYDKMMAEIIPLAKCFYTVTPPTPRALSSEDLASYLLDNGAPKAVACDQPEKALRQALSDASEDDVICAFGSLYYIGEIRSLLKK
ncbi:MAG: bifunctional folylpolyglutamate synthase/dihydrofolate synthase [Lachnospiraceae bacterium]|nr:bifunctional folylpolyglutamate synthase/dihydrofolate synthase [Lachnospiraceae bacterium]